MRIGFLPKWPMSAYSASAPVSASTTAPSDRKAMRPLSNRNATACSGLTAARMPGDLMMLITPIQASATNHITMMGAKKRPMPAVPCDCTEYSATSTAIVSHTTYGLKAGVATSRPSIADSTEMAGVITLSP